MNIIFFILFFISSAKSFTTNFFDNWHCIGIKQNIDFSKPYKINIGDLPLVLWKDNEKKLITAVNICKHMGTRLDTGQISNGCLKCPYHGLEYSAADKFGETIEHDGKIFWAYKPIFSKPYSIPFYNNKNYVSSFIEVDMECSLPDSAYNTMDVRHPEYVHSLGFGNKIPPQNIKQYKYNDKSRIGLAFDYLSSDIMKKINSNVKVTNNFHMYIYPTFSWSRVSFDKNHLIIGVNLLPIGKKKTRWYVTICHNYKKSDLGKDFMKMLALTILSQDHSQLREQNEESDLKKMLLFEHIFKNEEVILWLKSLFENYNYPNIQKCIELYENYKNSKN
jgi:nitrite reductase/ring-hydroxylating ferredoxin subunit